LLDALAAPRKHSWADALPPGGGSTLTRRFAGGGGSTFA